jgi:hypothetical protein
MWSKIDKMGPAILCKELTWLQKSPSEEVQTFLKPQSINKGCSYVGINFRWPFHGKLTFRCDHRNRFSLGFIRERSIGIRNKSVNNNLTLRTFLICIRC